MALIARLVTMIRYGLFHDLCSQQPSVHYYQYMVHGVCFLVMGNPSEELPRGSTTKDCCLSKLRAPGIAVIIGIVQNREGL